MKKAMTVAMLLVAVRAPAAAQETARFPVIAVFADTVRFQDFAAFRALDARATTNPTSWTYLDPGVAGAVRFLELRRGFRADQVFSHAVRGFSARLSARQIQELETDPMIKYIEPDGIMTAGQQILPWGIDKIGADLRSGRAGDGQGAVSNVNVYVIDTGIDVTHPDLNVVKHVTFADSINYDCHGHGTHVAGTIAAKDDGSYVVGVIPGAPLTGVKVLGCSGSGYTSWVIKGVDWVTANAARPAVANMSLGGSASIALDEALRRSVASGIFYAVAAGNSGADACNRSPARAGTAEGIMTVAAVDRYEKEPSWSNYGACVDIWAPGVSIISTWKGGTIKTLSGTSMATPHVAGVAALLLSRYRTLSPTTVEQQLKQDAVVTGTVSKDKRPIRRVYAGLY